jgi:hypothetical protein
MQMRITDSFSYQIMEMYLTEFEKIIANAIFLTNSLNAD